MGKFNNKPPLRALPNVPQGQQFQVDLRNATLQKCSCGSTLFTSAVEVYHVSHLISPTGQDLIAQNTVPICLECHKKLEEPGVRKQAEPLISN
jgi:5-methylcytosine-specific restriction endonuclease McrA